MNNFWKIGLASAGLAMTACLDAGAAEPFTRQLSPEEFASAGLDKLSATERARLDALVRAFMSGKPVAAAGIDSKTATMSATAEDTRAVHPDESAGNSSGKTGKSWLRKIRLTPGTAIEYESVESELVGPFSGWREGTVFTLGNGQQWRVVSGRYASPPDARPRRVKISPGTFGSFFLEIEGVRSRPKVTFVGTTD